MVLKVEHEVYEKDFQTKEIYVKLFKSRINEIKKLKKEIENHQKVFDENDIYSNNQAINKTRRETEDILKKIQKVVQEIENKIDELK